MNYAWSVELVLRLLLAAAIIWLLMPLFRVPRGYFGRRYRAGSRSADMKFLWPQLKARAQSLDHAKAGFYTHIVNDPAWTKDFTFPELQAFVDRLE